MDKITSESLADRLNEIASLNERAELGAGLINPWADGAVEIGGERYDVDYDASDLLAARRLGVELEDGHIRNESESRWLVVEGAAAEYTDGIGWREVEA
jgi:hypothetical protein